MRFVQDWLAFHQWAVPWNGDEGTRGGVENHVTAICDRNHKEIVPPVCNIRRPGENQNHGTF